MRFLGTSTKETQVGTTTKYDNIEDPRILSHQTLNTKKSFRFKKYTHVRISEVHSFCPREYSIGFLTDTAQENYVDFPLQQQFDIGTALHWYLQNKSKVFKDILNGWWMCKACNNYRLNKDGTRYFGTKPKGNCETCGALPGATEYEEFMFRVDEPYRIVGKMDAVMLQDGVYRFGDFKSYWQKPATGFPIGKDTIQLSSYMQFYTYLPDELKLPVPIDSSVGYLYYISKKFSFNESVLTYPVKPTEKLINKILSNVGAFTEATKTGIIPDPLDSCIKSDFSKGRSKDCYLSDTCKKMYYDGVKCLKI